MKRKETFARTILLLGVCISLIAASGCAYEPSQTQLSGPTPNQSSPVSLSTPSPVPLTNGSPSTIPQSSPELSAEEKLAEYTAYIRALNGLDENEALLALDALRALDTPLPDCAVDEFLAFMDRLCAALVLPNLETWPDLKLIANYAGFYMRLNQDEGIAWAVPDLAAIGYALIDKVSPEYAAYFTMIYREYEQGIKHIVADAALRISWRELAYFISGRLVFCLKHPDFSQTESLMLSVNRAMNWYYDGTNPLLNTPPYDENGLLPNVRESYEYFLQPYTGLENTPLYARLSGIEIVWRENEYKLTDEVKEYLAGLDTLPVYPTYTAELTDWNYESELEKLKSIHNNPDDYLNDGSETSHMLPFPEIQSTPDGAMFYVMESRMGWYGVFYDTNLDIISSIFLSSGHYSFAPAAGGELFATVSYPETMKTYLVKYDRAGNEVFSIDLADAGISRFAAARQVDARGNVYISDGHVLHLFSSDGEFIKTLKGEGQFVQLTPQGYAVKNNSEGMLYGYNADGVELWRRNVDEFMSLRYCAASQKVYCGWMNQNVAGDLPGGYPQSELGLYEISGQGYYRTYLDFTLQTDSGATTYRDISEMIAAVLGEQASHGQYDICAVDGNTLYIEVIWTDLSASWPDDVKLSIIKLSK